MRPRRSHAILVARTIAALPGLVLLGLTWIAACLARRWYARPPQVAQALAALGIPGTLVDARLAGGGRANAVLLVTVRGADGAERRLVLKRPLPHGSLLATLSRALGPMPYDPRVGGTERTTREARALAWLATAGVPAPRLYAHDPARGLLAMELVDGEPLAGELGGPAAVLHAARLGRAFAAVHRAGVALCDGHPGNALLGRGGRLVVIDLEFAAVGAEATPARRAFDRVYAAAFLPDEACRMAFRAGYGAVPAAIAAAEDDAARRLSPFAPLCEREGARGRRGAGETLWKEVRA